MINETASIVIHCPVEQVYEFMSVPKNRLRYDPKLIDVRQMPEGPLRPGTQIVEVARWFQATGFDRPRRKNLLKAAGTSLITGTKVS